MAAYNKGSYLSSGAPIQYLAPEKAAGIDFGRTWVERRALMSRTRAAHPATIRALTVLSQR